MAILFNFLMFYNIFLSKLLSVFEVSIDCHSTIKVFCESVGHQGKLGLSCKNAIYLTEVDIY